MYARPPDRGRQTVKIPENYSGSAFRDQGAHFSPYSSQKLNDAAIRDEFPTQPTQQPSEIQEFSESRADIPVEIVDMAVTESDSKDSSEAVNHGATYATASDKRLPGIIGGLLPISERSFPFGHGIGSEELLILAMMLLVFLSEENDRELLLYLGMLLFAG